MKTNTNKKWHKLPAGELQSIMQSDQEQQPRFQFDNTTYIFFIFMLFFFLLSGYIYFFVGGFSKSDSCVSNSNNNQTEEKRTVILFCFVFPYLATPDDHSETTSMASTGRQEQRGEKALVPHARTRSPK